MLDRIGFNQWAKEYDKSVKDSESEKKYPFSGYNKVIDFISQGVSSNKYTKILDIGFGTGVLTKKLYDTGCSITGIDFSDGMIEIANEKMPNAFFIQYDFTKGLPNQLKDTKFDCIISTYAIHHLENRAKVAFIKELLLHLEDSGVVMIGDVMFETQQELRECKQTSENWDDDEIYITIEYLRENFRELEFYKCSDCAGIACIKNQK